jgi:hypothetical protein
MIMVLVLIGILAAGYVVAKHISTTPTSSTLFSTKKLSYNLPNNFVVNTTSKPFSGFPGITEQFATGINSKATFTPTGIACGIGCSEPYEDIAIQDYIPVGNLTLEQFANKIDPTGQLKGMYATYNGYRAYCSQAIDNSQKQLKPLPSGVPWQIFRGYGCLLKWQSAVYQVKVADSGQSSAYFKEALQIVQSIKLTN